MWLLWLLSTNAYRTLPTGHCLQEEKRGERRKEEGKDEGKKKKKEGIKGKKN